MVVASGLLAPGDPSVEVSSSRNLLASMNRITSSSAHCSNYRHPTHLHTEVDERKKLQTLGFTTQPLFLHPLVIWLSLKVKGKTWSPP